VRLHIWAHSSVRLCVALCFDVRRTVSHNGGIRYEDPRRIAYSVRRTPRPASSVCVHACGVRRFGAKPDKKIVDRSSGKSEFMEDTVHGNSDGMVVGVDRFWVVRAAGWAEWLSGGEKGFDGFVSENEQRGHRPQPGW
jgi:hypothetical protein